MTSRSSATSRTRRSLHRCRSDAVADGIHPSLKAPRRGDIIILPSPMMWKVDEELQAAYKLPKWGRFHRACGEKKLFFDNIERRDKRDTYKCIAFTTMPSKCGGWMSVFVAQGVGKTVLDALGDALAKSEYDIPEAAALIAAGLEETQTTAAPDDFDTLMEDEFEGLEHRPARRSARRIQHRRRTLGRSCRSSSRNRAKSWMCSADPCNATA
jgi:hypothetical protein